MARLYARYHKGSVTGWYLEFRDPDKVPTKKRIALKTKDERIASETAKRLQIDYARGNYDPWTGRRKVLSLTLGEAAETILERRYSKLAESTYQNRKGVLKLFCDFVGHKKPLTNVSPKEIREWLNQYERGTLKTFYSQIKTFFNDCMRYDFIEWNPMSKVQTPRVPYQYQPKIVSDEEYERLLSVIESPWLHTLVQIAYHTGMRQGEIRNLRWEHVDLKRNIIEVKNTKWFKTKNRKDRVVPVPKQLNRILLDWKKRYMEHCWSTEPGAEAWVTLDGYGKPPSSMAAIMSFKRYRRMAGVDEEISLHTLRHTYASRMVRHGMPLHVLKEVLGHSNYQTVLIYTHFQTDDLSRWVNAVYEKEGDT